MKEEQGRRAKEETLKLIATNEEEAERQSSAGSDQTCARCDGTCTDCMNYRQLVDTTVEIAVTVGVADIVGRVVEDLKDESEPYCRIVMETIEKVVANLGASDIDAGLEELLIGLENWHFVCFPGADKR